MIKTINSLYMKRYDPSEMQPGFIISEGVIYDVDRTHAEDTGVLLHVPLGTVRVPPGHTVLVLGQLSHDATVTFVETMLEKTLA